MNFIRLQPVQWSVYRTDPDAIPCVAVKILSPETQEATICEKLQADLKSPNHTIPAEVVRSPSQPPLLLMPCLSGLNSVSFYHAPLSALLDMYHQMIEVSVPLIVPTDLTDVHSGSRIPPPPPYSTFGAQL